MDENKVSSGPTIIIVILLIMIILVSGYIVYERVYSTDNKQPDIVDNKDYESLYTNSYIVQRLYNKTNYSLGNTCYGLSNIVSEGVKKTSELSNERLLQMAYAYIKYQYPTLNTRTEPIKESTFKIVFYEVFGDNATYKAADFNYYDLHLTYNSTKQEYDPVDKNANKDGIVNPTQLCLINENEQITEARKYSDRIEIYTVALYCDGNGCYSDSNFKNKVEGNSTRDHSSTKGLEKYKYTFNEKDGNYYYYSIEKTNG